MIDPETLAEWDEMPRHPPKDEYAETRSAIAGEREMTWPELHELAARLSEKVGEYCGIPVPVPELRIRLAPGHPLGGLIDTDQYAGSAGRACTTAEVDDTERVRNRWFSRQRNAEIWILENSKGIFKLVAPVSPDRSMDRMTFWLNTLGASVAWSLDAELKAREKLRSLIAPHAYLMYELTGSFLELSPRSQVMYFFRRLRPTIAMVPHDRTKGDATHMKVLAVLCMHPIGYYEGSWAGVMCPTDDVIAHLLYMRGDERLFWRKANQHPSVSAEAGI